MLSSEAEVLGRNQQACGTVLLEQLEMCCLLQDTFGPYRVLGKEGLDAHGKANEKLKQALFYARFENLPPPPKCKGKQDSQTFCLQAKILVFGSQGFPANRVPGFPRKQTSQKLPSYSRTATGTLDLKREESCRHTEPGRNTCNSRTKVISTGPRAHKLLAFISSQRKERASQEHSLTEARACLEGPLFNSKRRVAFLGADDNITPH